MSSSLSRLPTLQASTCERALRAVTRFLQLVLVGSLSYGCNSGAPSSANPSVDPVAVAEQAVIVNGGFEAGDLSGWTVTAARNNGISVFPPTKFSDLGLASTSSCSGLTLDCLTSAVSIASIATSTPSGLTSGDTLKFPFDNTWAALVNDRGSGRRANVLTQVATLSAEDVDSTDGRIHLRFAVAPILENPGHPNNQQPYFFLEVNNLTTGVQLFQTFNFANQPGVNWQSSLLSEDLLFTDWKAFDISPPSGALSIGDRVMITVVGAGCSQSGHWGEIYVDEFGTSFSRPNVSVSAPAYTPQDQDLTYTITVKNGGGFAATDTLVDIDTPRLASSPSGLSETPNISTHLIGTSPVSSPGITCTTTTTGAGTSTGDHVQCPIGTIGAGSSYTFTVTIHVPIVPGDYVAPVYVNQGTYSITTDQYPTPLGGNLVQTVVTTDTIVDLKATLSDGVSGAIWGSTSTYVLDILNNSDVAINNFGVVDSAPAGLTINNWSCAKSNGACTPPASGSSAISSTESLPAHEHLTYTIEGFFSGGPTLSIVTYAAHAILPSGYAQLIPLNNYAQDANTVSASMATLTLAKSGAGSGNIVINPGAVACSSTCTGLAQDFAAGTGLALTVTTNSGSAFTGWSGACTGVTNPCVLTLSGSTTTTANFDELSFATAITSTSNSNSTNLRPGDTVNYAVELDVPYNFAWPIEVTDTWPVGLVSVTSTTPVLINTPTCSVGSCLLPTVSAGTSTLTTWDFGVVSCTNPSGCQINYVITARVAETATRGTVLTNSIAATNIAPVSLGAITVIEPNLTLSRSASPTTGLGVTEASHVTVTLTNGGAANAAAWLAGGVISFPASANLTASNYQAGTCPAATPSLGTDPITFTFPGGASPLGIGASCTFSYDLVVGSGATPNTPIAVAAGTVTSQSVAGSAPPAKSYSATDTGFSITPAQVANGKPCGGNSHCLSGVCDPIDHLCGLGDGHGTCTPQNGPTVCRSAVCSVSQLCEPPSSCFVDGDCTAAQFCNSETLLCAPKLDNGVAVPTVLGHTPSLNGVCSPDVALVVCKSGVCDADNKCGYSDGSGSCTQSSATACRSGLCAASGVCAVAGGCLVDGDCPATSYCDTPAKSCVPKLTNGTAIPVVAGHAPTLDGNCSVTAAAIVCASGVCDTDNRCGYSDGGSGSCSSATASACRSGLCTKSGVCGECALDSDCSNTQYCDTPTKHCVLKVANGAAIPSVPGHVPEVAGFCTAAAAAAVCLTGVCETADGRCGYADRQGSCTTDTAAVCRSGICSSAGVCAEPQGCVVDGDCPSTHFCNTSARLCTPKLVNGVAIPLIAGHIPPLTSVCNDAVATVVCASSVCSATDNRCGYADEKGTCTATNAATVCRSGLCSQSGVCSAIGRCLGDSDCSATQFCNTVDHVCSEKLKNGGQIPTLPNHVPVVLGNCTAANATLICSSGVCDPADNRCGFADGDGKCTSADAPSICRSTICSTAGVCGVPTGCVVDADCPATHYCNTPALTCAPKVVNGSPIPAINGHDPALAALCTDAAAKVACASSTCDVLDGLCGLPNGTGPCTSSNGASICRSAVCDVTDGKCGFADGSGSCNESNVLLVCRGGGCSSTGTCSTPNACMSDADCPVVQFCNTPKRTCDFKLQNGTRIPTIAGHDPSLAGTCSPAVATSVCSSKICDTKDNTCGYADGSGPCTAITASVVCRSGACSSAAVCLAASACQRDADCSAAQYCDTVRNTCSAKLANGTAIPTIANHDPALTGVCNELVGKAVCASQTCDATDNKCGLASGKGPCDSLAGASSCRTGVCLSSGICGELGKCATDADCAAGQSCSSLSNQCVASNQSTQSNTSTGNYGGTLEGGGIKCAIDRVGSTHRGTTLALVCGLGALVLTRKRRRAA